MKIFGIVIISVFLSACSAMVKEDIKSEPIELEQTSLILKQEEKKEAYSLYLNTDDYNLALYEPKEGSYLGSYILSNKKINFDINEFEGITGKKHSLYVYNMKLGDPFPSSFILNCVSNMTTPYIIIRPPDENDPFQYDLLEETAKSFGEFYVPIFVELYPITKNVDYFHDDYKSFFKKSRDYFKNQASNVAFVWSVSSDQVQNSNFYYPGDEYTDWVGFSFYSEIIDTDKVYEKEIFNDLDYFYYQYQKTKPIIISELGISHYSSENHIYYTNEAADEISTIYHRLINDYPRIKMINYMDFNGIEISPDKKTGNNFSVTDDEKVLTSYKAAINTEQYLSELDMLSTGDKTVACIKTPFTAYKIGNEYFISEKSIVYDMKISGISSLPDFSAQEKFIDNEKYINMNLIEKNGFGKIRLDDSNKKIWIDIK